MQLARVLRLALDILFPPTDTARLVQESSSETFEVLLSPRVTASGAISLLPYRHPLVRAAIIETKFHRNPAAIAFLSAVLSEYLESFAEERSAFKHPEYVLVPIPLGSARLHARGYNQVEEVAERIADVAPLLVRARETRPQTSLSRRERIRNMENAFAAVGPLDPNRTYIVLDDVMTTGATLEAAVQALRVAGAQDVLTLTLAH